MKFSHPFKIVKILAVIAIMASGCEPCNDCGPENAYPYFNLSILNRTSLDTLKAENKVLQEDLKAINAEIQDIENAPIVDSLNNKKAEIEASIRNISSLIKITESKLISIQSINGETNLFANKNGGDSLTKFKIPLDIIEPQSEYDIVIEHADFSNYLKISYELSDTVINNKITKAAKDLKVVTHDFDSLRGPFGCEPLIECTTNQLEIYVEI